MLRTHIMLEPLMSNHALHVTGLYLFIICSSGTRWLHHCAYLKQLYMRQLFQVP